MLLNNHVLSFLTHNTFLKMAEKKDSGDKNMWTTPSALCICAKDFTA